MRPFQEKNPRDRVPTKQKPPHPPPSMRKYRLVSKKGEGTFSEVLKAQNVKRGSYHAIKVSFSNNRLIHPSVPMHVPKRSSPCTKTSAPNRHPVHCQDYHLRSTVVASAVCSTSSIPVIVRSPFSTIYNPIHSPLSNVFLSFNLCPILLPFRATQCMRNHFESIDQVNTLREIQALRRLSPHPHIITLEEVLYDQPTGRLALVFELMDQNLYEVIRGRRHYLSPQLIKIYIYQLLKGLEHMHRKGIFHRDIKVRV